MLGQSGRLIPEFIPAFPLRTEPSLWSWSAGRSDVLPEYARWTWTVRLSRTAATGWSGKRDQIFESTAQTMDVCGEVLSSPWYPDPWSQRAFRGQGWPAGRSHFVCPIAGCGIYLPGSNTWHQVFWFTHLRGELAFFLRVLKQPNTFPSFLTSHPYLQQLFQQVNYKRKLR